MTLSSAYIELFIRGKSPEGNVRGEMSGYHADKCIFTSEMDLGICRKFLERTMSFMDWLHIHQLTSHNYGEILTIRRNVSGPKCVLYSTVNLALVYCT